MPRHQPEADADNARGLQRCIESDADLYRQQFVPIVQNLMRKRAKGTYDSTKAAKLFGYLADSGAKKCAKFYDDDRRPWHAVFPPADRRAVARAMEESFRVEADLGNYDNPMMSGKRGR